MSDADLSEAVEEMINAIADQSAVIRKLEGKIDDQNERLEEFVPKRRFRVYMVVVALAVLLVVAFTFWSSILPSR